VTDCAVEETFQDHLRASHREGPQALTKGERKELVGKYSPQRVKGPKDKFEFEGPIQAV